VSSLSLRAINSAPEFVVAPVPTSGFFPFQKFCIIPVKLPVYSLSFENVPTCEFIIELVVPVALLNMFSTTSPPHEKMYLYQGSSFDLGHENTMFFDSGCILTVFVEPSGRVIIAPSHGNIPGSTTFPVLSTTGTHEPEP
jgi:hypothetical protein